MTEQDITQYVMWTRNVLRNEERPVVSRLRGIHEWTGGFSATAARVDRFLKLGHGGSMVLPQSLVLDIIKLDQAALTDALDPEGLLKNIVFFWDAVADVYGSTGTSSQTEAKRLDLLMEWSLLLTALPGSSYPGMKLLGSRYRHERGRLALTKLRKEEVNFAHAVSGLQLVQEHEATLGLSWDMRSASFTRIVGTAGEGLKNASQPQDECGGKTIDRDPKFSVAASIARAAEKPTFNFELFGNWRDHWRNTVV